MLAWLTHFGTVLVQTIFDVLPIAAVIFGYQFLIISQPIAQLKQVITGFAYVLMGLAVVHFITRGQPWRGFALWGLYAALLVLSTGVSLAIALLGLADGFVSIRRRTGTPPPASGGGRPPGG